MRRSNSMASSRSSSNSTQKGSPGSHFSSLQLLTERLSTSLSQENADELLGQLIGWYYDALASSTGLVARKLSSAISTFFIHFHQWWPRLLQYMSQRLTQYFGGVGVGTEVLHLRAMIWVLANILEDCAKLDLNSPQRYVDSLMFYRAWNVV